MFLMITKVTEIRFGGAAIYLAPGESSMDVLSLLCDKLVKAKFESGCVRALSASAEGDTYS